MAFTIYDASVPVFIRQLDGLNKVLTKAASFAEARKLDPSVLLGMRLAPDMFPLTQQIQSATDQANAGACHLAGTEVKDIPRTETTLPELQTRITKTIDHLKSLKPEQFTGAEGRDIVLMLGPKKDFRLEFKGAGHLTAFSMPNFYFHVTTAYDILRHAGVEIGKRDFLNSI